MVKRSPKKRYNNRNAKYNPNAYKYLIILVAIASLIITVAVLRSTYLNKRGAFDSFSETGYAQQYPVRGVDVSHHNEYVDWQMLRENDIFFAYMKSTEGSTHIDREYAVNYSLAKEVGMKIGTYHFYTFGENGREQAYHFISNSNIESGDLIPAIDVEHSRSNRVAKTDVAYSKLIDELKILEETIAEYYGVKPIIYTNKECFKLYIKDNFPDNPLWICDLFSEPSNEYSHWDIWQFSHTGNLTGVFGDIDLNFYRGTFEEFKSLLIP